jgi:hypothetical protein
MAALRKGDATGIPFVSVDELQRLAGPVDDETAAEIMKLGASADEVEIAAGYVAGDGDRLDRLGHSLTGKVAEIYEILSTVEQGVGGEE